jgi:uncharacterized protein YbjT (DUF2867 family)
MPGPVLVMGAAGKTGLAITRCLAAQGVPVRAAVRAGRPVDGVYAAGASEVARVDLTTGQGLRQAVRGVGAIYQMAPNVHPDEQGMARRVVEAAAAGSVPRLVFHSVLQPDDPRMPHHVRKAAAEQVVRAFPGVWTVLRPAAYHQNLVGPALSGRIRVPYSLDAPFTNVDLEDVAAVAARVLLEPGHDRTTYDLAGSEWLSVSELAAIAAEVLARPVVAEQVSREDWVTGPAAQLPEQARSDLLAMFAAYDATGLVGDSTTLRQLLGERPVTWADCLRRVARDAAAGAEDRDEATP